MHWYAPIPTASFHKLACAVLLAPLSLWAQVAESPSRHDIVIRNATVMTVMVVDATGKYVTPGIIDPHSHSALDNDINEATGPVTPSMMMDDAGCL
jgi:hypothetical protein